MAEADKQLLKQRVREFWDAVPCDTKEVPFPPGSAEFFDFIEQRRYATQVHLPGLIASLRGAGDKVLDVGGGIGTDARLFARRGAQVTILDISRQSLRLAQESFGQRGLKSRCIQGDSENLPFPGDFFDVVWSHGSLHHTPNTQQAIDEIHRVLKPGGVAMVMLYHRHSYDYWVNMRLFRKLALKLMLRPQGLTLVQRVTGLSPEFLEQYRAFAREQGRLSLKEYINQNTDGLGNPLSMLYSRSQGKEMFRRFRQVSALVYYLNRRNLPILGQWVPDSIMYLLGRAFGFFLYLKAYK